MKYDNKRYVTEVVMVLYILLKSYYTFSSGFRGGGLES